MRLYLSGPIKGLALPDAQANFIDAALTLTRRGYECVNPFDCAPVCLPDCTQLGDAHYDCFMRADIAALMSCEGVALLDGWEASRGARLEQSIAVMTGLDVRTIHYWPILDRQPVPVGGVNTQ